MKYQILALDIDGTVINSDKKLTDKTRDTILRAQELGVKVVLASGRPAHGVAPLAEQLELERFEGYILSFNGAKIVDCKTKKTVFEQTFGPEWIPKLYGVAKKSAVHILTYARDGGTIITEHPDDYYIQLESRINALPVRAVDSFPDAVHHPVNKCLMTGESEHLSKLEPVVRDFVGGRLNVFRSEPFFLEIMPNNVDKAFALQKLLETLGLSREELMACGDGFNDVSMLRFAGRGVAMENAQESAKDAADFVTLSNNDDGVAYAVDKFIL